MSFGETDTHEIRRRSRDHASQQFAEHVLAGLRRPAYSGVFRRLPGTKTPTYLCELLLDGHHRNLTIRLKTLATETNQESVRPRHVATIKGLPLSWKHTPFDLVRHDPANGYHHLKGMLDLGAGQLAMTVLSHCNVRVFAPWICVLEILRSEG